MYKEIIDVTEEMLCSTSAGIIVSIGRDIIIKPGCRIWLNLENIDITKISMVGLQHKQNGIMVYEPSTEVVEMGVIAASKSSIDFATRPVNNYPLLNPLTFDKNFKVFKPDGDSNREYFFITDDGFIVDNIWENSTSDNELYNDGRIYKTYESAKYALKNRWVKIKNKTPIMIIRLHSGR